MPCGYYIVNAVNVTTGTYPKTVHLCVSSDCLRIIFFFFMRYNFTV
jgi:hypothetical protein